MMPGAILTLNCGSSSIKFALFERGERRLLRGRIENLGSETRLDARKADGVPVAEWRPEAGGYEGFFQKILSLASDHLDGRPLIAVGHRVVHGGDYFTAPCLLTEEVRKALRILEPLAPLHQPHNLAAVDAVARLRPGLPQVACFDTAFHQTMPVTARRFGLPLALEHTGLRRYGFHGLSYEFVAGRLKAVSPEIASGRVLVAHLGSGASMCAMKDGRSVDTSMGFSTLDGLVMGSRCGALDPGVLIYLMRQGMDASALEDMLYSRAGLLGVSGISADMRVLLTSKSAEASNAVDLFVFRAAREAAALISSMGGVDAIVFTAGIGENSPDIRRRICERLAWLGLALDPAANLENRLAIHATSSRVRVWVLPTDEEQMIAHHTFSTALEADQPPRAQHRLA
jgi:acetate kinase